jgi:hypothetical protein
MNSSKKRNYPFIEDYTLSPLLKKIKYHHNNTSIFFRSSFFPQRFWKNPNEKNFSNFFHDSFHNFFYSPIMISIPTFINQQNIPNPIPIPNLQNVFEQINNFHSNYLFNPLMDFSNENNLNEKENKNNRMDID